MCDQVHHTYTTKQANSHSVQEVSLLVNFDVHGIHISHIIKATPIQRFFHTGSVNKLASKLSRP